MGEAEYLKLREFFDAALRRASGRRGEAWRHSTQSFLTASGQS